MEKLETQLLKKAQRALRLALKDWPINPGGSWVLYLHEEDRRACETVLAEVTEFLEDP